MILRCSNKRCSNLLQATAYKLCEECRAIERNKKKEKRAERISDNKCRECGNHLDNGELLVCKTCCSKKRTNNQNLYNKTKKVLWEKAREICSSAKVRAKEEKVAFNITIEFIYTKLVREVCEVTELPFEFHQPVRGPWSPTLDRWNPQIPDYTEENTKLTVWAFNTFKFRWETEDWCLLLKHCLIAYGLINPNTLGSIQLPTRVSSLATNAFTSSNETLSLATPIELDKSKVENWFYQAQYRASKEGAAFEFTIEEFRKILSTGICQLTGLPLDLSNYQQPDFSILGNPRASFLAANLGGLPPELTAPAKGHLPEKILAYTDVTPLTPRNSMKKDAIYNPWSPSIHRIDPKIRDYSKENTMFVCWAYNVAKSNFTDADFCTLLEILGKKLGYIDDSSIQKLELPPKIHTDGEFCVLPVVVTPTQDTYVAAKQKLLSSDSPPDSPPNSVEEKPAATQNAPSTASPMEEKPSQLIAKYKRLYPHLSEEAVLIEAQKIESIKRQLLSGRGLP